MLAGDIEVSGDTNIDRNDVSHCEERRQSSTYLSGEPGVLDLLLLHVC